MAVDTDWFRDRLAEKKMSQRGLARAMGLDAAAVSLMLRGKRDMKMPEAAQVARLLGVPAEEVMAAAGVRIDSRGEMIPLVAIIDGSGEAHWQPDGQVPHPGAGLPAELHAGQCRTTGTDLEHMDGWVLFSNASPTKGVPTESVGRLSYCKIKNGVIYLAAPHRSYQRGRWDLTGPVGRMSGVEIEWSKPVLLIQP